MPDLLTPQILATAGPLVLETLFKHFIASKTEHDEKGKARQDLLYDEAFVIMKTFLEIATKHPAAALQRFSQVRTPAPPWVALHRVIIPPPSLSTAAEYMITALGGEEMAYKIAGGTKWWQVRAGSGVEAEWIVMKRDWKEYTRRKGEEGKRKGKENEKEKAREEEEKVRAEREARRGSEGMVGEDGGVGENGEFRSEMNELRCMLYIHGGAYYWGSINTHRYVIWRYARKMHGRCFAVNYRKAPQYPFPCAIHDCLAAWIYLTNPPPGAKHKPVHPKNIILAGDSAGGGLVWALLQILRDTPGLELPAGAVLISPWSDLTHSFPSILTNTATDIVPPYSFIHKPSSLWPPPPPSLTDEIQNNLRTRVKETVSHWRNDHNPTDEPHHKVSLFGQNKNDPKIPLVDDRPVSIPDQLRTSAPRDHGHGHHKTDTLHPISAKGEVDHHPGPDGEITHNPSRANPAALFASLATRNPNGEKAGGPTTLAQCDTPLILDVKGDQVVVDTQIQLYATNAQLCHPWVSPVLGYLGGLPPLFICAGDNEVLRDEIVYMAHKAANPGDHPIRDDVKAMYPSLNGIEERHGPTDVHLQVYDGTCHDLPLLSMTKPARGLFRAVASFARYVTPQAPGSLSISKSQFNTPAPSIPSTPPILLEASSDVIMNNQIPILERTVSPEPATPPFVTPAGSIRSFLARSVEVEVNDVVDTPREMSESSISGSRSRHTRFDESASGSGFEESGRGIGFRENGRGSGRADTEVEGDDAGPRFGEGGGDGDGDGVADSKAGPGEAGHSGIYKGSNPFPNHMIRERVSPLGICRPLEPPQDLPSMSMPRSEIGFIKEGPALRYLNGQALWDKKFRHAKKVVGRHRERNLKEARERDTRRIVGMWQERVRIGKEDRERERVRRGGGEGGGGEVGGGEGVGEGEGWVSDATEGSVEGTPKGNKAKDKSNEKGKFVDLVDQSWSWTWALHGEAPPPSAIVSRRDFGEARQHALMADRVDSTHETPVHGLSIWVGLASFFTNSPDRGKAQEALRQAMQVNKADKEARKEEKSRENGVGNGKKKGNGSVGRKMGALFGLRRKESSGDTESAGSE